MRKIVKFGMLLFIGAAVVRLCESSEEDKFIDDTVTIEPTAPITAYQKSSSYDMESAIAKIETVATAAERSTKSDISLYGDPEKQYEAMSYIIDDLTESIKQSDNVYKFIEAKGLRRIMSNYLAIPNKKLRTSLLLLLKEMFYLAPTTTDAMTPINVADRLLDIFDHDDNLALKAHALDILYMWLPNNPKIQTRVMKVKGLEPFYNQVNKLDVGVVQTLMDLFNKILKEHIYVRNEKQEQLDDANLVMYQRIGLLERMSTKPVCNGLLNIFEMLWSHNKNDNPSIPLFFDLLKNIKPYCMDAFKSIPKARDMFEALLKVVKNEERRKYFELHKINVGEVTNIIQDYVDKLKYAVKDEF